MLGLEPTLPRAERLRSGVVALDVGLVGFVGLGLVGYTWSRPTRRRALLYDTSLAGYANSGHEGPAYSGGIDWRAEPRKLWDLLEYLKTL